MFKLNIFYELPIWGVSLLILVTLVLAIALGYRIGLKKRAVWKDAESGGGSIVLTSMFALLGLVVAFTYAAGVSRYDARKAAVMVEANALGTAFLRADLVAEPGRSRLRQTLLEYARTRSIPPGTIKTPADRQAVIENTLQKLAMIWPETKQAIQQGKPGPVELSLVTAINDVLDAHTMRMVAVFDKLPVIVIWMLLLVAAASLSVAGFNAGIQGHISRWRMGAFALVLTGVITVILDFDRPNDGIVVVSHRSIDMVIADMESALMGMPGYRPGHDTDAAQAHD
jgi:hypothetical protein